jgi:spermidine/putrescine transport system substrate-binding protein
MDSQQFGSMGQEFGQGFGQGLTRRSRRQFLRQAAHALLGLGATQALSGCGWRLGNVRSGPVKASTDELFLYTWAQYVDDDLLRDFQEKSGLKTIRELFDSNEKMIAALQAGKGDSFSLLYPSEYFIPKLVKAKLLAELDHDRIRGLDNLMPQFRQSIADKDNHYGIPFAWGTTGLIYNQEKVSDEIEDWNYLWKNKEKLLRKMSLLDDYREVMGFCLKTLGYSINETQPDRLKEAYEKLSRLKPFISNFTTDGWRNKMASGDLWIAMAYSSDAISLLKENPKLRYVIPKQGGTRWSDWMVIPKSAPNPNAAYTWMNYLLNPEVAASVSQRLAVTTPNAAALPLLLPELQQNPVSYPSADIMARCESMTALTPEAEKLYDKYWTQLTS